MGLHVSEEGNPASPILVFLHGGGVSSWMWKRQVTYFKEKYFVLTIDLPSHGSSRDVPFQTINKAATEIINIIERYRNGEPITLVGFSLGAQVAVEMLSLNAEVVDRAVIISALTEPMKYSSLLLLPTLKLSLPLVKNRAFSKIQAKYAYIEPEDMDIYYEETVQMRTEAFIAFMKENMAYRLPVGFTHSRADMLVLVGSMEKDIMKQS